MVSFEVKLPWKVLVIVTLLAVASVGFVLATQKAASFHGVGVLKSADSFAFVNDTVTYQIKVYNPSDFDLMNINVTDDLLGFNDTIPFMTANNETGITYVLQRMVLDTDPNPLVNTVTVEAVDSEGVYSTASTQAKTTILERMLDLTKWGPDFAHEGDSIQYTIVVTSLADVPLYNVTVKDDVLGFSWIGDLSVGESNMFNITYVVPSGSEDPLTNKVTAWAQLNETTIYAEATWTVDILHPSLDVNKTVTPAQVYEGENVTYTITVTNIGDAELFNLTLVDSMVGHPPESIIPASLMSNESFSWSYNVTIHECVCNVAIATGVDALGKEVVAHDYAHVKEKCECNVCTWPHSFGFWKTHPELWPQCDIKFAHMAYTKEQALSTLIGVNAKDATRMLAAQLIAAKLNRLCGTCPTFYYCDKSTNIDDVIMQADEFLCDHPLGSNPKGDYRQAALGLKDMLDAYNNNEGD